MLSKKIPILLTLLAFSACAVETVNPPEPAGTVFSGDTAGFGGSNTDTTPGGVDDGGNAIGSGFRASIQKGAGEPTEISTGGRNTFALYTAPLATLTPSVFGGNEFHNFSIVFNGSPGQAAKQYALAPLQSWTDLSKAGFSYTQGTTGDTVTMTGIQGTLTVLGFSDTKLVGELTVTGQVEGQTTSISAEFSVPVQQQ
jgi:hypothetical protein